MTGHSSTTVTCITCKQLFTCNPNRIPRILRQPVCGNCMKIMNIKRKELGLRPFAILDGAYDPAPESEDR